MNIFFSQLLSIIKVASLVPSHAYLHQTALMPCCFVHCTPIINYHYCLLTLRLGGILIYSDSQAARLLGPPASFEASKLKVVTMREETNNYYGIIPRTYILSHCDFTANLTLTISKVINLDQVCILII